jgi:ribosomal protein S18 acetylase RimI-like enzyme
MSLRFVPYDDNVHREQFFQLNLEYITWVNTETYKKHKLQLIPAGSEREYIESVFSEYTKIKPPEGIIYILESEGNAVGMGALKKLEEGIGEIKRMYIRSNYRGGLGKQLLGLLEDKAREFGFNILRLDTNDVAEAAIHLYRKSGFKETTPYQGGEWDSRKDLLFIGIFMEKKL